MLHTPILFLVFNRLDTTQQVFAKIREAQPRQLFIGSDGARVGKEGEADKVESVRKYILDNIDWDCEVKTLFREQNLGCGVAPAEAITWFFENVEQGIILEDDCLPDASFFTFCEELLNYYKDNEQIMHIGGTNSQFGILRGKYSYYFSKYPHIWGWATWRKSWQKFRFTFTSVKDVDLEGVFQYYNFKPQERQHWIELFEIIREGKRKDIWDIQWTFSCWLHKGIGIVSNKNLISNIGFNQEGTHTINTQSILANKILQRIDIIKHPYNIEIHQKADFYTFKKYNLQEPNLATYIRTKISSFVPKFIKKILKAVK